MFPWGEISTATLQSVCRDLNARRTADRAREDALELLHTLEIGVANALQRQQSMPPPPKRKYQRRIPAPIRAPTPFPMAPPSPAPTPVAAQKRRTHRRVVNTGIASGPPVETRITRSIRSPTPVVTTKRTQAPASRVRNDTSQHPRTKTQSPNKKRKLVFDGVEVDFPPALRRHYYQRCQSSSPETTDDPYSDQVSTPGAELEEDSQSVHSDDILRLGRT